ncbi:hypothetical protein FGRMN_6059 [Fusarium graminum]|nr:hypothetical protein FGRMN_6059 [Fusarium graminum]
MARPMDTHDDIAIAEIVVYTFLLLGAIFLCTAHGFSRNAGWFNIIILSLARLIGSSMLLATINDPGNTNLYIGWITLNGIGLGPLILILLGLLGRCYDSIRHQGGMTIPALYQRAVHLMMLAAVILLSVGGANSNYTLDGASPIIKYSTESKIGAVLMVIVLVLVIGQFILALLNQSYIMDGERRLLIAVGASLPFVVVRLAYTCFLILGGHKQEVWLYLGAGVIMEMVVVIICEAVGFTLRKAQKPTESDQASHDASNKA